MHTGIGGEINVALLITNHACLLRTSLSLALGLLLILMSKLAMVVQSTMGSGTS